MADTCLLAGVHSICMVVNKLELSGCGPMCSLDHKNLMINVFRNDDLRT